MKLSDVVGAPQQGKLKLSDVTDTQQTGEGLVEGQPLFVGAYGDLVAPPDIMQSYNKANWATLKGTAMGVEHVAAGWAQTAIQGLSKIGALPPEAVPAFTQAQVSLQNRVEGEDKGTLSSDIGEFMGEGLTYLFGGGAIIKAVPWLQKLYEAGKFLPRLLASSIGGGVIGGTQFEEDPTDRATQAFRGALAGAGGEVGATVTSKAAVKIANASIVKDFMNTATNLAQDWQKDGEGLPKFFQEKQTSIERRRAADFGARNQLGDHFFPQVDVTNLRTGLESLQSEAETRFGKGEGTAYSVLSAALRQIDDPVIAAVKKMGLDPKDPSAAKIIAALRKQMPGAPPTTYSKLDDMYLDMQSRLGSMSEGERSTTLVRQAATMVRNELKGMDAQFPSLQRAAKRAMTHFEEVVLPSRTGIFDPIADAAGAAGQGPTWFKANQRIVDTFTEDDTQLAERLWRTLPPQGRQLAQKAVLMQGIEKASLGEGTIDPATFTAYLKDLPAKDILFRSPKDKAIINGLENVISATAIKKGQAALKVGTPHFFNMEGWGARSFLRGQFGAGVSDFAAGYMTAKAHLLLRKLLGSQNGLNLLAAASKVGPNTPRMASLMRTMMLRYSSLPAAVPGVRDTMGDGADTTGTAADLAGSTAGAGLSAFGSLFQ